MIAYDPNERPTAEEINLLLTEICTPFNNKKWKDKNGKKSYTNNNLFFKNSNILISKFPFFFHKLLIIIKIFFLFNFIFLLSF